MNLSDEVPLSLFTTVVGAIFWARCLFLLEMRW
jgi:hypothetical protein